MDSQALVIMLWALAPLLVMVVAAVGLSRYSGPEPQPLTVRTSSVERDRADV